MASMAWRAPAASVTRLASQPSPSRPTRRNAASERPPIQIGRRPPCGGFGSIAIDTVG